MQIIFRGKRTRFVSLFLLCVMKIYSSVYVKKIILKKGLIEKKTAGDDASPALITRNFLSYTNP